MALDPGTCAYVDRVYEKNPVRLAFEEEQKAHITWRASADASTTPTITVRADGLRSDHFYMKAMVNKAGWIGSYEAFNR